MKTAGFQYVNVLGISLLVTTFAWTSLLGARDTDLSVPRMMNAARLFERQGRQLKAAEMYRRVLRAAPGNVYAAKRLNVLRAVSSRLMELSNAGADVWPVSSLELRSEAVPQVDLNGSDQRARSPKKILDSTRSALAKIRRKIAGQPPRPAPITLAGGEKNARKLFPGRSPLWDRLDPSLRGLADIMVLSPPEKKARGHQSLVPRTDDAAAVTLLVDAVTYTPDAESALAAYMMGTRTTGQHSVMISLGEQLAARKGFARVHVAEALLRLDGNHVAATDALIEMVSASEKKEVRMLAVLAMQSAAATQRDRCIQVLVRLLSDADSALRTAGALALGGYGRSARVAVPALMKLVRDRDVDTARAAGVALRCVFPEPVVPVTRTSYRPAVTHGS